MDWPNQSQDVNAIVINSFSPEALGTEASTIATTASTASAWPTANRAFYIPFLVYEPAMLVKLHWFNGGTIGSNVDMGVYDDGFNRLISTGSTAQSGTTTAQSVDITDTPVLPGVYYMGLALDSTTGFIARLASAVVPTYGAWGMLMQDSAFPLPDPATPVAMTVLHLPSCSVTMRTLI